MSAGTAPISPDDVAGLMAFAEAIAREAGLLVQKDRPARVAVAGTKSSPTDVVTEMDRAAERLLRERIAGARPNDAVLGEEAGMAAGTGVGREAGAAALTWVVDPIDGTVNYLYGIPAYAVSVAVVTGDPTVPGAWQPVAGCVHNPASGETWTAGAGLGAYLDGERLRTPEPPELAGALVGTGFGYREARRRAQAAVVAAVLPGVRDIRRIGCASVDLCLVATGRLDAYYEKGLNPWDLAAGWLVVTESGGDVTGIDGHPAGERMLVAARRPLLDALVERLETLDAGADS